MPARGVTSFSNVVALKQLGTPVENLSGKAISTGPVLEHAISVHASATPIDAAKMDSGRLPNNSLVLCKPNLRCRANAALRWIYPRIYQSVTYFPDLVTTSGERIFNAYWS